MIYFIQQEHTWAVKIGYTEDQATLRHRLRTLQTGSPYPLAVVFVWQGGVEQELELHERFAAHRLCGEWFRPCEGIANYIASCKAWQEQNARVTAAA